MDHRLIPCWNCSAEKPLEGPCRKCGKSPEQRFDTPPYKEINKWLAKLNCLDAPIDALMTIPEQQLGLEFRIDTIDATLDLVIGVHIKRRKEKLRPKLVVPS